MTLIIDESKLKEIEEAHRELVRQLNILKAGADVEGAQKLFDELTTPDDFWLDVRRVALLNKKPRFAMMPGLFNRGDDGHYEMCDPAPTEGCEALEVVRIAVHNIALATMK